MLLKKNIDGVFSDSVAKSKLGEYERSLSELNIESQKYVSPDVMEKDLLNYSLEFMKDMTKVWDSLQIEHRYKLQKLLFPDGLVYLNREFTTPVKSCLIELNEMVGVENSSLVTLRRILLRKVPHSAGSNPLKLVRLQARTSIKTGVNPKGLPPIFMVTLRRILLRKAIAPLRYAIVDTTEVKFDS